MSKKRSFIGNFIHTKWTNINIRAGKYRHLQTSEKCKTYNNVHILFSRLEFKNWCIEREALIKSLNRPSIDRIDKNKNYSLDNIQIIELIDNIRKEKIKAKNGFCVCYRCKCNKPLNTFSKDKRRLNGYSTICKKCDILRKQK